MRMVWTWLEVVLRSHQPVRAVSGGAPSPSSPSITGVTRRSSPRLGLHPIQPRFRNGRCEILRYSPAERRWIVSAIRLARVAGRLAV